MSRQYRTSLAVAQESIDMPLELENQFILRLPPEPAESLKAAIKTGDPNISSRLQIKLEHDKNNPHQLRRGFLKLDNKEYAAKMVDLPTIIESQKTIDRKTFYKTADISQMLICKEGEPSDDDEPLPKKPTASGKEQIKVDKKYMYPHGICPPLKNCRKRRFRKVLRKSCPEAPEIEKEVRHLLRVDNDAVSVKWELITDDELNAGKPTDRANSFVPNPTGISGSQDAAIDPSDLFGALTDSEDENCDAESEGEFEPDSSDLNTSGTGPNLTSELQKEMFDETSREVEESIQKMENESRVAGENRVAASLEKLQEEISTLQREKQNIESSMLSCGNPALLEKFKGLLMKLEDDIRQREMDIDAMSLMFT